MAVSIRLDPEIEQRLDYLAAQTGRTKSYCLREVIAADLEDLEDFYLADATMERVRKGQEAVIDAAEVRASISNKSALSVFMMKSALAIQKN